MDNENYLSTFNETFSLIDNIFDELNLSDKVNKLLELSNDESKKVRLGALVCLYLLIKQNFDSLDENTKNSIVTEKISLLQSYKKQDQIFSLSCIEICPLFGPHEIIIENFGVICMFLTFFNFPKL